MDGMVAIVTASSNFDFDSSISGADGGVIQEDMACRQVLPSLLFFGQATMSFLGKILVTPSWREKYRTLYCLGKI